MKIFWPGRSLCLLLITSFSATKHVTVCFQPSQADRRTASLVYVNIRSSCILIALLRSAREEPPWGASKKTGLGERWRMNECIIVLCEWLLKIINIKKSGIMPPNLYKYMVVAPDTWCILFVSTICRHLVFNILETLASQRPNSWT